MELIKCGAINGSKKTLHPGKVVYTFCVGNRELWDFMDHNEMFLGLEIDEVNDPNVIARNDNLVSVNNALMVDLTGQVASESIGTYQYSATGGQVSYVQGAQMSKGGKSILTLPSTRTDKEGNLHSRILPTFPEGTVCTTSRNDVEWVVTEHGAVRLTHQPISSRVKQLVSIAHPQFRDELIFKAKNIGWI
jgi:4-hydroxybutyrate CoA-transferase